MNALVIVGTVAACCFLKLLYQHIRENVLHLKGSEPIFKGKFSLKVCGSDADEVESEQVSEESRHIAYLICDDLYVEGIVPCFDAFLADPDIEGRFLFLCDGEGCSEKCHCTNTECRHTSNICHARNYAKIAGQIKRKGT